MPDTNTFSDSNFSVFQFPTQEERNIVYSVGVAWRGEFYSFYIGETTRQVGRVGDYLSANFYALLDFSFNFSFGIE